ncbi:LOW QUALITY PROTEIN: uncharacterized protein LOC142483267, partial [Ascaphus truei]|uniref:LOW QUALITY PROTEIN: uncharacterized protein LOC142483267 n=1 Tax=Ascaphus truei TaxID=8439 RepID=UPI003F5ACA1B
SHKDKEREKQKHRKRHDSPSHLTAPTLLPVTAEKHDSSKESPDIVRSEVKGKKPSCHRGRKAGVGKGASGGGAFPAGSPPSPLTADLVSFPKLEEQEEEEEEGDDEDEGAGPPRPPHPSPPELTFSSFGSIMRFSGAPGGPPRPWVPSPGEYSAPQRWGREGPDPPREKKHKGSKRLKTRHGPGRPRGSKNKEHPPLSTAPPPLPPPTRHYTHPPALHSLTLDSPLLSSGIYTSNKDPISLRTSCSTPLPSNLPPLLQDLLHHPFFLRVHHAGQTGGAPGRERGG